MADYYEIFDDTRAGILGALDRAVTEAHAWEFLHHWEPEWEMVSLPSIENRLSNRDAYDNDVYNDCFDIIWKIARSDWLAFRETYMEEHPPCRCRQLQGKLADNCWPRYPGEDEEPMCNEIRDYSLVVIDNERIERLQSLDRAVTQRSDWEYWADGVQEGWEYRVRTYGVDGVTREDIEIIADIAEVGWRQYVDGAISGRLDARVVNEVD